jgi:hypothetical protein
MLRAARQTGTPASCNARPANELLLAFPLTRPQDALR